MNISLLPEPERRLIELNRQAALLIYNHRKKVINRSEILKHISLLPNHEQDTFKGLLNKYQDIRK